MDSALIGRRVARITMKWYLSLALLACASVSSAPSSGGSPQERVISLAGDPQPASDSRALRGRQKRRPCAKSIATYCTTAKNAAR